MGDAVALVERGTDRVCAFACPSCGCVYPVKGDESVALQLAQACCARGCIDCGKDVSPGWSRCVRCFHALQAPSEQGAVHSARKVLAEEYDDPVCWPGHVGSFGAGYFEDVSELLDYCEDHDVPVPGWVWACTPVPLRVDAQEVIDRALEEHHEGASEWLLSNGVRDLQEALDAWCKRQLVQTWLLDHSCIVVLDAEAEELKAG